MASVSALLFIDHFFDEGETIRLLPGDLITRPGSRFPEPPALESVGCYKQLHHSQSLPPSTPSARHHRFVCEVAIRQSKALPAGHNEGPSMKLLFISTCVFVGLFATSASAIDLAELAPCRPAAAMLCDRSGGMTWYNLLRCGATLAANSWRVGSECRAVLRKYGQL